MNQNPKKIIPLILGMAAAFFSLLSIIMHIVVKADAWSYIGDVIFLLSTGGLLALIILDFINLKFSNLFYFIPLAGLTLCYLISGIHSLISIGDTYKDFRYSYFNSFISNLIYIVLIIFLAIGLYKVSTKSSFFVIPAAYLVISYAMSAFLIFNRLFFSFFTDAEAKYPLSELFITLSYLLFMIIYVCFYRNIKKSSANA